MIDQLLTLADAQVITGGPTTGFMISEHTINLGNTYDPFVAGQMYAMFTVTTAFAAATTATDNVQILIKATTSAAPLVVGSKDIQALQLTIGATTRYRDVDLTKSHQIPIALNPQGINAILSLTTSGGYLTIYGLIVMENAAYAAVNFNAGAFDLDIRSYNAAGQKYYAQTRSVG